MPMISKSSLQSGLCVVSKGALTDASILSSAAVLFDPALAGLPPKATRFESPDKALSGLTVAAAAQPGGLLLKLAMSAFVVRGLDEDALAGRLFEFTTAGLGLAEGALAGRLLLDSEASASGRAKKV